MRVWIVTRRQQVLTGDDVDAQTLRALIDEYDDVQRAHELNRDKLVAAVVADELSIEPARVTVAADSVGPQPKTKNRKPAARAKAAKRPSRPSRTPPGTRATLTINESTLAKCRTCAVPFRHREQIVVCNVHEHGRWHHLETYHVACYDTAGQPHGPHGSMPTPRATGPRPEASTGRQKTCKGDWCSNTFAITATNKAQLWCGDPVCTARRNAAKKEAARA